MTKPPEKCEEKIGNLPWKNYYKKATQQCSVLWILCLYIYIYIFLYIFGYLENSLAYITSPYLDFVTAKEIYIYGENIILSTYVNDNKW